MPARRSRPLVVAGALALGASISFSATALGGASDPSGSGPHVTEASHFAVFDGSVADLPTRKATEARRRSPREAFGNPGGAGSPGEQAGSPDPLRNRKRSDSGDEPTPATETSFEGISQAQAGFRPPDTNGDVGPDHYVQSVNAAFQIWDKTGTSLAGPTAINQLWVAASAGGLCQANNRGDPVVLYDDFADRWLITQFAFGRDGAGNRMAPYAQCAAVSQTGDPVNGGWFLYEFAAEDLPATSPTTVFPDFPKWGVWRDGYYFSTNEIPGGAGVYAVDRTAMLAGQPTPEQIYFKQAGEEFFLPADADGPTLPPAGAPEVFAEVDDAANQLQVYEFAADFTTPANSTFTLTDTVPVAAFDDDVCGAGSVEGNCVPQPGVPGDFWLEPLTRERLMHRLQYLNHGTHETLVASHTVDANGSDLAGVRWYELRQPGGAWTLQQQGTHSPDGTSRWLGSVAMDTAGNIGLSYSVSSATVFPGIRYTHQDAGDPAGTMEAEQTLMNGSGSQTCTFNEDTDSDGIDDFCRNRWGDYSSISVDPTDNCTFWVTNEYVNSAGNWQTRIGSFDLCTVPIAEASPNPMNFGTEDVGDIGPAQTLTVSNTGDANLVISIVSKLGPNAADFLIANDDCEGQTVPPNGSCPIELRFAPSAIGPRAATLRIASNDPNSPLDVAMTGIGAGPPTPSGNCNGLAVTVGGATKHDDKIVGTSGDDVIRGGRGDDVIRGLGGKDTICGEHGDDRVGAGTGRDFVNGSLGTDNLKGSDQADMLRGGRHDDGLNGGNGGDSLHGQDGADRLRGRSGRDDLHGGGGDDYCNGGSRDDVAGGCERVSLVP